MSSGDSCPPKPTSDEIKDAAEKALNAMNASSTCKSNFRSLTDNKELTMSGLALAPFAFGIGSTTVTDNTLDENNTREGCGSIFANISQQITSTQNILCTLNKSDNRTTVSASANSTIKIVSKPPTDNLTRQNIALLNSIKNPPQPQLVTGMSDSTYNSLLASYNETVKSNNKLKEMFTPSITVTNSSFKNVVSSEVNVITNTSKVDTTKLVENANKVATTQAVQTLDQKTGYGANSPQVKQLIQSKLEDRTQSITDAINATMNNITIKASSSSTFNMESYGAINLAGIVVDQYVQMRVIAKNIMTIATNMGKEIANSIIQDSASTSSSTTNTAGQEAALKEIYDGFANITKENAEGAAGLIDSTFDGVSNVVEAVGSVFTGVFTIIIFVVVAAIAAVLIFVPNLLPIPKKGQGAIGIIISVILTYFIVAWFMSWWPFGKDNMEQPMPPANGIRPVKLPYQFKNTGKFSGYAFTETLNEKRTKSGNLI